MRSGSVVDSENLQMVSTKKISDNGETPNYELEYLRERDRAIGLEQQLRRTTSGALQQEAASRVAQMESSTEYKVGLAITAPARLGKKIFNKAKRTLRKLVRSSSQVR